MRAASWPAIALLAKRRRGAGLPGDRGVADSLVRIAPVAKTVAITSDGDRWRTNAAT